MLDVILVPTYGLNLVDTVPTGNYLLKVNDRNTRTRCDICSKLTINSKSPMASSCLYC